MSKSIKVRVRLDMPEGFVGFFDDVRVFPNGKEFVIREKKHSLTGETISAESQFSSKWMEKMDAANLSKPGPEVDRDVAPASTEAVKKKKKSS